MEVSLSELTQVEHFSNFFHKIWSEEKPICKLFRTNTTGYFYDTGTNKILGCDDYEYNFIEKLLLLDIDEAINKILLEIDEEKFMNTARNIVSTIAKENVLLTKKATQFGRSSHFKNFNELINNSLGMIQLEVTEKCNLRCEYCIYNRQVKEIRNHGKKDMKPFIAFAAIDYLAEHSKKKEEVAVTFYGGEPLLRFPLIKTCVDYSMKKMKNKKISFSLTTNGTLLSPKMANYFASIDNFSIVISLDGPQEVHDNYRKDRYGKGSFNRTISGLKYLSGAFGDKFVDRIILSMVYAPPYSSNKLFQISELWKKYSWLDSRISIQFTYPHKGSIPRKKIEQYSEPEDKTLKDWTVEVFKNERNMKVNYNTIAYNVLVRNLAPIFQREIFQKPIAKYHLNGCCIPAVRKMYVTANGEFKLCERIANAPSIGNVSTGVDVNLIEELFIKKYAEKSLPFCSECWAIQLCSICYTSAFNNKKIDISMKNMRCNEERFSILHNLTHYCHLLEEDRNGLDFLGEIVIS